MTPIRVPIEAVRIVVAAWEQALRDLGLPPHPRAASAPAPHTAAAPP